MKVALAGYGRRGDVEPLAALGRQLLRRGYDAWVGVTPTVVGFVESVGLATVAYGLDLQAIGAEDFARDATIQNPVSVIAQLMERLPHAVAQWGAALMELASGADLLLALPYLRTTAANVAECYGIPIATLHFFPGDMRARMA